MTRAEAENKLRNIFGHPSFYDEQWKTIDALLRGDRILLIEKTGYGKSLCYQFPATQFDGITVVFSPLVALMRDQISYLKSKNISAECINSEQDEKTNTEIMQRAKKGEIKILYIAPERQENLEWIETVRSLKLSMVVIDEAHCISVWGHDFRPAFKRIINLVKLLPKNFPVLATTATATERVANDIIQQVGSDMKLIRGNLMRENFRLAVICVDSEESKLAWLAEFLTKQIGTGIVYTGTRINTSIFSTWMQNLDFSVVNYNAGLEPEVRKEIEKGLMENKYQCVISTNALGMGIDKPDLRFIVHTQIPASLIHYYQEIGRAGRDGKPCRIVLLYHPDDKDLQLAFIRNSRPSVSQYNRVISILRTEPLGERDLMRRANLTQTQVRVIRSDLIDQGIVHEVRYGSSAKYEIQFGSKELDVGVFDELRSFKMNELERMIAYAEAQTGGMEILCAYLGDAHSKTNDNCIRRNYTPSADWKSKVALYQNLNFPELELKSKTDNLTNGVAASYYGFTNIGSIIHRCKYESGEDFPSQLVEKTLNAFHKYFGEEKFDILMYVPPTESGDLVKHFAEAIARELRIPLLHSLKKTRTTQPQKVFQNWGLKFENVKDAFNIDRLELINGKSILLIDDIGDSGATIKEIGRMLTKYGAVKIVPLVIAKTIGSSAGDNRDFVKINFSKKGDGNTSVSSATEVQLQKQKPEILPFKIIIEHLKKWRSEIAGKRSLPLYSILPNATIAYIAAQRPTCLTELLTIPGIGPIILEKYGEEILDVLCECGIKITKQSLKEILGHEPTYNQQSKEHRRYPNMGKMWTTKEEEEMIQMFCDGVSINEIAKQLQRSKVAIESRLMKLGLT